MSCMLNVIYYIRAISHLVQERTRQEKEREWGEKRGGRGERKIPHPACENLCQISPETRSPSLGLASMPWRGNRIWRRTVTNLVSDTLEVPTRCMCPFCEHYFFPLVFSLCEHEVSPCADMRSCEQLRTIMNTHVCVPTLGRRRS